MIRPKVSQSIERISITLATSLIIVLILIRSGLYEWIDKLQPETWLLAIAFAFGLGMMISAIGVLWISHGLQVYLQQFSQQNLQAIQQLVLLYSSRGLPRTTRSDPRLSNVAKFLLNHSLDHGCCSVCGASYDDPADTNNHGYIFRAGRKIRCPIPEALRIARMS